MLPGLVLPNFPLDRAAKAHRGDGKHGEGEQPPGDDPGAGQTPGTEERERDRGGNGPVVPDDELDQNITNARTPRTTLLINASLKKTGGG